ncbi:hypothetical protein Fcan01_25217 [Folsomia candida]|uniref:Uncharacterized protein n=1 Tax=Folsomia candida TaxID=158441 RepID=A0A226D3V9_FOLCA|nr:hypothetical protein Fcan01_25217 [Folsomia candida]
MTLEMASSVGGDREEIEEDPLAKSIKAIVGEVLDKKFDEFQGLVIGEMRKLVDKVTHIEKRQDDLEEKVELLTAGIHNEFSAVREEIPEQRRRIIRMSNIVMMGVPETSAGLQVAKDIIKIIAPSFSGAIVDNRIGDSSGRKPRPLRISFRSISRRRMRHFQCARNWLGWRRTLPYQ